jgi:hypothetical protein
MVEIFIGFGSDHMMSMSGCSESKTTNDPAGWFMALCAQPELLCRNYVYRSSLPHSNGPFKGSTYQPTNVSTYKPPYQRLPKFDTTAQNFLNYSQIRNCCAFSFSPAGWFAAPRCHHRGRCHFCTRQRISGKFGWLPGRTHRPPPRNGFRCLPAPGQNRRRSRTAPCPPGNAANTFAGSAA